MYWYGIYLIHNLIIFCAQERTPQGTKATLSTYDVKVRSTIRVMVLLCEVPDDLEHAVFDLYWGYPNRGRDYLDASALFFSKKTRVAIFDYCHGSNKDFSPESVTHSGDLMDDAKETGHHLITVRLHRLPPTITNIFFVLSAWSSPTISFFKAAIAEFLRQGKTRRNSFARIMSKVSRVFRLSSCAEWTKSRTESGGFITWENSAVEMR